MCQCDECVHACVSAYVRPSERMREELCTWRSARLVWGPRWRRSRCLTEPKGNEGEPYVPLRESRIASLASRRQVGRPPTHSCSRNLQLAVLSIALFAIRHAPSIYLSARISAKLVNYWIIALLQAQKLIPHIWQAKYPWWCKIFLFYENTI